MIARLPSLRRTLACLVGAALLVSVVPRADLFRCFMMGTLHDSPSCCGASSTNAQDAPSIGASCFQRLVGHLTAIEGARPTPPRAPAASACTVALIALAPSLPSSRTPLDAGHPARGAPPDARLRVPTVVLRV